MLFKKSLAVMVVIHIMFVTFSPSASANCLDYSGYRPSASCAALGTAACCCGSLLAGGFCGGAVAFAQEYIPSKWGAPFWLAMLMDAVCAGGCSVGGACCCYKAYQKLPTDEQKHSYKDVRACADWRHEITAECTLATDERTTLFTSLSQRVDLSAYVPLDEIQMTFNDIHVQLNDAHKKLYEDLIDKFPKTRLTIYDVILNFVVYGLEEEELCSDDRDELFSWFSKVPLKKSRTETLDWLEAKGRFDIVQAQGASLQKLGIDVVHPFYAHMKTEAELLHDMVVGPQMQITTTNTNNAALRVNIATRDAAIKSKKETVADLTTQQAGNTASIEQLSHNLEAVATTLRLQKENEGWQADIEKLNGETSALEALNGSDREAITESEKDLATLFEKKRLAYDAFLQALNTVRPTR